jgi:hypothetical protein
MQMIDTAFSGPIDIVGDIHGEIDALRELLRHLGYDAGGAHPRGRRLIFIGDLTDRGPDSPAVLELVAGLVSRGLAQCVMGNHELNLLRQARKEGNGWYFARDHDRPNGKFLDCRAMDETGRAKAHAFLAALPIALERDDVRLVHAAWHGASIAEIRASTLQPLELYALHHARALQLGEDTGLIELVRSELAAVGGRLHDPDQAVAMLPGLAALDAMYQDANPLRIVTSGLERVAERPFFASGKWRMVDRVPWWNHYRDELPVVIGHYWRWPTAVARTAYSRGEPDLFAEFESHEWFGAKRNVFCVDFSVGARYKERAGGAARRFDCRLGALRWPERELLLDDGTRRETG